MKMTLAAGAAAGVAHTIVPAQAASNGGISWKSFRAGANGFFRAPVLLTGTSEAILIDGGFTLPDGKAVAEAIAETGRKLTTIYISQSDPDYYFSLGPIKAAFPDARVLAAPETLKAIMGNVEKKLAVWGPKLGEYGPQKLEDVVMPEAFSGPSMSLEGETIEIVEATHLPDRRYHWVPSLQAIFGGVMVFSGVHVWTADTATPELRAGWIKELEAMAERSPIIAVPGHASADAPDGLAAITFTRDYLLAFEQELSKAADSAALIKAMTVRYPSADMGIALDIGAKVATGEMKWG
jgi:glyoxylase-like metal-dependent hydrolase (beta-lactamase superfamily II)